MNRLLSFRSHFCSVIRLRWKRALCFLFLLCITVAGCHAIISKKHAPTPLLWGSWQCSEQPELSLVLEPDRLTINGLCLSYEFLEPLLESPTREQPQQFVLDGGSLGVLSGLLFWDEEALVLDIDGDQRRFLQADAPDADR